LRAASAGCRYVMNIASVIELTGEFNVDRSSPLA
jgi:hypothetical protein